MSIIINYLKEDMKNYTRILKGNHQKQMGDGVIN